MSVISNIIFGGAEHYITSPYGKRSVINTAAGQTASFHRGTDYGTNGKKLPQYAIEDGTVLSCGTASDGAKYVWVKYPRIGKKFLHYHLDSIAVKSGQAVKKGTLLGKTGKTGKATGVHLHLGIKDLQHTKTRKHTQRNIRRRPAHSQSLLRRSSRRRGILRKATSRRTSARSHRSCTPRFRRIQRNPRSATHTART